MQTAAAVTMVRDDLFFLKAWLRHYGGTLGRENCYVVNHGRGSEVADLAAGCNVIGLPGDAHRNFDIKRWGFLNGLVGGLRRYYRYVIVGDVDELVVVDPDAGTDLRGFLEAVPDRRVLTPLGLEVIHRVDVEQDAITDRVLGPRRHVRPAPQYSKPCVIGAPTKISRGGHFSQFGKLYTPENLYLLHLKFCDYDHYAAAMDRRNAVTAEIGAGISDSAVGRHWFASERGDDKATFEAFTRLPLVDDFNFRPTRRRMQRSWRPRGETGYHEFDRTDPGTQYVLPERFTGLV
ncbi:hypothetical protein R5H30_06670 [Sulfitobacter sp. D35]|uniref:glycosyltransferase family 2 protein n=1 Tax=Sulfitobacter sp. D35 TaxID=3083252 RepID=UPI00296E3E85|nr:glycosyltransferase family 2 protein [Sulfitobacter sp. D35]MDW4497657.1 hypothetical protein [Sulfitobacter sp. D35]